MANDSYHNSTGYWKDPNDGRDLAQDEPRVQTCKPGEPFAWPMIALANGDIVKLNSKLWSADEKQCYKEYRNGGAAVKKPAVHKDTSSESSEQGARKSRRDAIAEQPKQLVKYDAESVSIDATSDIIRQCDKLYGVSQIAGLTYILCGQRGSKTVHHIPRCLVPDAEYDRLMEC